MTMTPEERCEIWLEHFYNGGTEFNKDGLATLVSAAENDVLERAAETVARFLSTRAISKPICEVIRGLKHGVGD